MVKKPFKLNLGAGPNWEKDGWITVDHKKSSAEAWSIPLPDKSCEIVFCSHMIEHISFYKIDKVISEINRVLIIGGTLRIICPDLFKLVKAYVEGNSKEFDRFIEENPAIRRDLGLGGSFMNFVISPGEDQFMFSRTGEFIGGYAHISAWDFNMLKRVLSKYGFGNIVESSFLKNSIPELREPLHLVGAKPEWIPEKYWDSQIAKK